MSGRQRGVVSPEALLHLTRADNLLRSIDIGAMGLCHL
jgi:hypothetical protein